MKIWLEREVGAMMDEYERHLWLDGDSGLKPYLRMKGQGMPENKIEQIAWLLLSGSGCGFCKVCRDEPCNIKDGELCTDNIADYIRRTVVNEYNAVLSIMGREDTQCCGTCLYFNGKEGDGMQFCDDKGTDVYEGGYCYRYMEKG